MATTGLHDSMPRGEPTPAPELLAFDHVEWWVGNARQAAHFAVTALGFEVVAYAGPETGRRDRQSYVARQGDLTFVFTGALDPGSPVAEHVRRHGDGVRDVAYRVADAHEVHRRAVGRGGAADRAPERSEDEHGEVVRASVHAYGETVHSVIARDGYRGAFLPGYVPWALPGGDGPRVGLTGWDHIVANVPEGELDRWVDWYGRVWGMRELQHFDADAISTEYSALRSTVVWNGGAVVQPINEPAPGRRTSQIAEYLEYYDGPGVQHLALATDDIVAAVAALRERGIRFLDVPATYYPDARERLGALGDALPWSRLAELGILVDHDEHGYLLQIFTETVTGRPTLFLEIIQRAGARGFGEGNFKALFVAIEAEQARRGNL